MPYIKECRKQWALVNPVGSGELNYKLTQAVIDYIAANKLSYGTINDVVGALECAKAEFLRRIVTPYENKKLYENGDVYLGWF